MKSVFVITDLTSTGYPILTVYSTLDKARECISSITEKHRKFVEIHEEFIDEPCMEPVYHDYLENL